MKCWECPVRNECIHNDVEEKEQYSKYCKYVQQIKLKKGQINEQNPVRQNKPQGKDTRTVGKCVKGEVGE